LTGLREVDAISSVAFNHDGTRIITGHWDKIIKIWDSHTGQEIVTLYGHNESVLSVAFNHNGTRIVSGSSDTTVKIWTSINHNNTDYKLDFNFSSKTQLEIIDCNFNGASLLGREKKVIQQMGVNL